MDGRPSGCCGLNTCKAGAEILGSILDNRKMYELTGTRLAVDVNDILVRYISHSENGDTRS